MNPDEENESRRKVREENERLRFRDEGELRNRAWIAQEASLLKWVGQYKDAQMRERELLPPGAVDFEPTNLETRTIHTDIGDFIGMESYAFPELGRHSVRVFNGLEENLFRYLVEGDRRSSAIAEANYVRFGTSDKTEPTRNPFESVSPQGACMIIEGLE